MAYRKLRKLSFAWNFEMSQLFGRSQSSWGISAYFTFLTASV